MRRAPCLGLLICAACRPDATPGSVPCTAELSETMATLPVVSWTAPGGEAGEGRVIYGLTGGATVETEVQVGAAQRHLLLGLPAASEVGYEAVDGAGDPVCSGLIETGPLPDRVPELTLERDDLGEVGPALLTSIWEPGSLRSHLVITDRQGQVRWYHLGESDRLMVDPQPALDGQGLLVNQFDSRRTDDVGELRAIDWEGRVGASVHLPMGHHMFAELPDGTVAFQQLDLRDWEDPETGELTPVVGDAIVELEAGGAARTVYRTWDHLEYDPEAQEGIISIYPAGEDWTHGNALKHDPEAGTYLLSLANLGLVLELDAESGEPLRTLGGEALPVGEGSRPLVHQHDPTLLAEDRLLVFLTDEESSTSGAVEYELRDGALHEVWSHGFEDGQRAFWLGQATRLEGGATRVNFGSAGILEEVDADGVVRWQISAEVGNTIAQTRELAGFPILEP